MTDLMQALASLSPAERADMVRRMRAGLSASRRPAADGVGPRAEQLQAEMDRLRNGAVTSLLERPHPAGGAWRRGVPRTGWSLLRIEDTGLAGGACCELCESATMRFSYVMCCAHEGALAIPRTAGGEDIHACRLCAAHLLGGKPKWQKSVRTGSGRDFKRTSPAGQPHWGMNRARLGELRPARHTRP